jgi:membrane associated rhomboid family serine protease
MIPLKDDIPTSHRPVVTVALIAVNVAVYLYQFALGPHVEAFIWEFGAVPWELVHFEEVTPAHAAPIVLTIFTSMFLHGGFLHLGSNMLFLWIFGNNVEDKLGRLQFLLFYLVSGVVAVLTFVLTSPNAQVPLVGASGAVAGLLGVYVVAYPRARVLTLIWVFFFVRLVWLPAVFFLGAWFVLQLLYGLPTLGAAGASGVAYFAHIGGFVFGLAYCRFWCKRRGGFIR